MTTFLAGRTMAVVGTVFCVQRTLWGEESGSYILTTTIWTRGS